MGNSAAVKVPRYGPPHDYTLHIIPRPSVNIEPGTSFLEGFGDTSKANIEVPWPDSPQCVQLIFTNKKYSITDFGNFPFLCLNKKILIWATFFIEPILRNCHFSVSIAMKNPPLGPW